MVPCELADLVISAATREAMRVGLQLEIFTDRETVAVGSAGVRSWRDDQTRSVLIVFRQRKSHDPDQHDAA